DHTTDRPLPLDRPLRPLRGDADDRPRRHRRERRPSLDPGRPGLLDLEPRLGGQRLSHRLRRAAPARGPPRRPRRPPPRLPRGTRRLQRRLAALRPRPVAGGADRRPLPPGRRRRADLRGDPRDDRDDVPRAAGAGEGHRRLRVRRLGGRRGRPAGRRRADPVDQLALDLLREPPDRHRDRRLRAAADRARRGNRLRRRLGRPGRGPDHERADARRLHDRRAGRRPRLDRRAHPAPGRDLPRPARRLRGPRGDRREPAHAAADLPLAQRRRRERRPDPRGRRDVRHVLPRRALPPAGPRLRRPADRARVPAGHRAHGRAVGPLHRPPGHALRRAPPRAARPRALRGRPRALHPGAGRRRVRGARPAGDGPARDGRRAVLPRADDARDVGRDAERRGPRLRAHQHGGAGRRRARPRGPRHPVGLPDHEPVTGGRDPRGRPRRWLPPRVLDRRGPRGRGDRGGRDGAAAGRARGQGPGGGAGAGRPRAGLRDGL
ncbi:MAG: Uncharacterized MFS-type transporter, partial [uncultured Solirubrobacteraceae bacterium]